MKSLNQQELISQLYYEQIKTLTTNTIRKEKYGDVKIGLGLNSSNETLKTTLSDSKLPRQIRSQSVEHPLGFEVID